MGLHRPGIAACTAALAWKSTAGANGGAEAIGQEQKLKAAE